MTKLSILQIETFIQQMKEDMKILLKDNTYTFEEVKETLKKMIKEQNY